MPKAKNSTERKKNSRHRHVFNFFILLPLLIFFYTNCLKALNIPTFTPTFWDYAAALALSFAFLPIILGAQAAALHDWLHSVRYGGILR